MFGKRSPQISMFSADTQYLDKVGRDSFYGFLATHRHKIFRDEDFADLYCRNFGRKSVPPSLLAIALLLQSYDRVSDEEVVNRSTFDLRWSVALGTEPCEQPFAKSTFQLFRAKLILNERAQDIFKRSLSYARELGFLKNRKIKAALDSTPILGKGAVKDTYNLLADGIRKLIATLDKLSVKGLRRWLKRRFGRYFGKSFKGQVDIDWDDEKARQALLKSVVCDVKTLLSLADHHKESLSEDDPQSQQLEQCMRLLSYLVEQDVEEDSAGEVTIKQGVSRDRIVSVHDTEMRHGRKSQKQRFDGHKATIAVDTETKLITATEVIAGNAHDGNNALALCEQSAENTGCEVDTVIGDTAYGTGPVRRQFSDANIKVIAKAPPGSRRGRFSKEHFTIDVEAGRVTCPAGHTTTKWHYKHERARQGSKVKRKIFIFEAALCAKCPWYSQCVSSNKGGGRTISLHAEEALLQEARDFQKSKIFKEQYRQRTVAENRIARLVHLGIRKARYFGRKKTGFQLAMAAAVANFTLIAAWIRQNPDEYHINTLFVFIMMIIFAQFIVIINLRKPRLAYAKSLL